MTNVRLALEKWANQLALLLLLIFFGRLVLAAAANAVTFDEVLHIFQGVLYWQHDQLFAVVRNPPLVNAVIGMPVSLTFKPVLPPDLDFYANRDWLEVSKSFMWTVNTNGLQLVWAGRLAIMLLATLLGAVIYRWGRELFGKLAGLFALALFTLDPNVLANSQLATTDLGAAFFIFLAAYLVWSFWRPAGSQGKHPGLYLATGVAVGLAFAAKFTSVVLLPALLLISLFRLWTIRPGWHKAGQMLVELTGWLVIGGLVFLTVYRFEWATLRLDFSLQQAHQLGGHSAFLLGQTSQEGWWYYFPVIFALKTPLPVLALIGLGLVLFARRWPWDWQLTWLLLLVGGIAAVSLTSRVNIGYRYLLPALPLIYLFLGQLTRTFSRTVSWSLILALLWLTIASLWINPDYLAYFNELAGGPAQGWRLAVDSNLDWGQDLKALAARLQTRETPAINASWLGTAPLSVYGIQGRVMQGWPWQKEDPLFDWFYPQRPAPGTYMLSATQLQGVYLDDKRRFALFRDRPPDDRVGYSLFIHDVPADGPPVGVALSGIGLSTINPDDFDLAFGSNDVRPRWFDARTAFLWPGGGDVKSAWLAIGDGHRPANPALQALYPPGGESWHGQGSDGLGYQVYSWRKSPVAEGVTRNPGGVLSDFGFSNREDSEADLAAQSRQSLPESAIFGEALELIGYQPLWPADPEPGQPLELLTYWLVRQPVDSELKIFVHLMDQNGQIVAQHDGLDILSEGLQPGDEFVQLHTLALQPGFQSGLYNLRLGVYNAETLARLTVPAGTEPVDHLWLRPIVFADSQTTGE